MPAILEALGADPGETIALVGAGGTTGVSLRLAGELQGAGRRVLSTSTVYTHEMRPALPFYFLMEPDLTTAQRLLPDLLRRYGHVMLATNRERADKIEGIDPAWVAVLAGIPEVDNIVLQADGARHRLLKAPKDGEPALPGHVDILLVAAGLDAVGKPLGEEHVHRPERVALLTGLREGDTISPEAVARVLSHPEGGLKNAPRGARAWFMLTGWSPENDAPARDLARIALQLAPGARGVLLVGRGHSGAVEAIHND